MIHIIDKANCCGCTACYSICPKNAISMRPDNEGFLYPVIEEKSCIDCGLCEGVCPILNKKEHEEETKGYIVRYEDSQIVNESTSGGAFTAFASHLIERGAVVYGAGYDENMQVICKKADTPEALKEMRGSKFVQSTLGETFKEIKDQLMDGTVILFTGTPCQVAGLISFLGKKPPNLICIDFVCRGVPSPGLWRNYIAMMEKKYNSRVINARFKHKTYGYHATTMKLDFANGKSWYGSGRVDPMMKAFVNEMASRHSCSACSFKGIKRLSDITMFDCYEFSKITGKFDDNKGYTSLFVHTKNGENLLNAILPKLTVYSVAVDALVTQNGIMVNNSARPSEYRDQFYKLIATEAIDTAMQQINPISKKDRLIEKSKGVLFKTGLIRVVKKMKRKRTIVVVEKETGI